MKRLFDIVVSALGLVVLTPLFALIALTVLVSLGRPILFRQSRPGRGGRPFVIIKFRTMKATRDASGALLSDGERLTKVGHFLRSASLDELPELWNVLRGEMSLVGPRPLLEEYLPLYSPRQARRHEVRPGITGWAQINGRNATSWEDKFEMDVWYVDNRSLWLDLKILALTPARVLARRGITRPGYATSPPFRGRKEGRSQ